MRAKSALVIEPAASWRRLQHAGELFFENLEAQMRENHRRFLEALMSYERQCYLQARRDECTAERVDQANGSYVRGLTTRLGAWDCECPGSVPGVSTARCCRVTRGGSRWLPPAAVVNASSSASLTT